MTFPHTVVSPDIGKGRSTQTRDDDRHADAATLLFRGVGIRVESASEARDGSNRDLDRP